MGCVSSTTLRCLFVLLLRVRLRGARGVLNHSFSLSVYGNISHIYSIFSFKGQLQLAYSTHAKNVCANFLDLRNSLVVCFLTHRHHTHHWITLFQCVTQYVCRFTRHTGMMLIQHVCGVDHSHTVAVTLWDTHRLFCVSCVGLLP